MVARRPRSEASQDRGQRPPPPRRPAPTMTAETHLQGVEISAAQFFEIWHHYDSDGDSFPSGAAGARGARGASPREAGGTAALPARERPGPRPPPQPRSRRERGRCRERRRGAARREGAAGSETPLPALENGESLEGAVTAAVTLSVVHSGNGFMDGKELQNFIQELQQARKKAGLVG